MSEVLANIPNRSERRRIQRTESKRMRKEEKKLMKTVPNGGKYNPKKSHKIAPFNPQKIQEKQEKVITVVKKNAAPIIKVSASEPRDIVDDALVTTDVTSEEIKTSEEKEKEIQVQPEVPVSTFTITTIDIIETANNDKEEINQQEVIITEETNNCNDATPISVEPNQVNDETSVKIIETIQEKQENVREQQDLFKEAEEKQINHEKEQVLVDAAPIIKASTAEEAPAVVEVPVPVASVSDKTLSPSTTTSTSSKKKINIIARIFNKTNKTENIKSKKSVEEKTTPEKKKKVKAWKIWKKL